MISLASEFKFWMRGFKDTVVLIPGWAADYRIFSTLGLNYNYILPIKFYPFKFNSELLEFLNKRAINRVSLFGLSLGGFLAAEFASKNRDRVNELILLSIRKKYPENTLEEVKYQLKKNKKAYMYKFYLRCFSNNDKEGLEWFKKYLLRAYLHKIILQDLIYSLDYLSQAEINAESLAPVKKIRIFHGEKDSIAPLQEAKEIKSSLPRAKFICLPGVGHIPFLAQNFIGKFYNG